MFPFKKELILLLRFKGALFVKDFTNSIDVVRLNQVMKDERVEFSSLNPDLDFLTTTKCPEFFKKPFCYPSKEIYQKLQPIVGISSKANEVHSSRRKVVGSCTLSPISKKFKRLLKPFPKHFSRRMRFILKSLVAKGNSESFKSFDSHFKGDGLHPNVLEERCVLMQVPSLAS